MNKDDELNWSLIRLQADHNSYFVSVTETKASFEMMQDFGNSQFPVGVT